MYLIECKDEDGSLFNLMAGAVFPTAVPAPSLAAVFSNLDDAVTFARSIDPRTWEGPVCQANGHHYHLRKTTLRIAKVTLTLATVVEELL